MKTYVILITHQPHAPEQWMATFTDGKDTGQFFGAATPHELLALVGGALGLVRSNPKLEVQRDE